MAQQPNAGAAGANGEGPQEHGAAVADEQPLNGAVRLPQIGGGRTHAAGQAAAPALVAPVAGAHVARARFPPGPALDVDGALLGPMPRKSNESCKLLPKIADETWS